MKELTHKEFSSKGGNRRAEVLSAGRRKEIAKMGGMARGMKKKHVDNSLDLPLSKV